MKILLFVAMLGLVGACGSKGGYVDVNTGKTLTLKKGSKTGYMVNVETKKPVYIYANPFSGDTFYGTFCNEKLNTRNDGSIWLSSWGFLSQLLE